MINREVMHLNRISTVKERRKEHESMYKLLHDKFEQLDLLPKNGNGRTIDGLFERQRRNIGKAHGLAGEIRHLSKRAIAALKDGRRKDTEFYLGDMDIRMRELKALDVPEDFLWQMTSEAGQEFVEAHFAYLLYGPIINGDPKPDNIPTPDELLVKPACWLAGIADAATEMARIMHKRLLDRKMSAEDRIDLRLRFIEITSQIYDALELFETATPQVINNSRRRDFGGTYRGMLGRVRSMIDREIELLSEILDKKSAP